MHYYNFPSFSVVKQCLPGAGQGDYMGLAERALEPVIPDEQSFRTR